jgi:sulfur carrier protein
MEINQEIVPRSQYAQTALQSNDKIEVVHAIGGG